MYAYIIEWSHSILESMSKTKIIYKRYIIHITIYHGIPAINAYLFSTILEDPEASTLSRRAIDTRVHGIKRSSFEYESEKRKRRGAKKNPKRNVSVIKGYCSQRCVCAREAKWTDKLARRCLRGRRLGLRGGSQPFVRTMPSFTVHWFREIPMTRPRLSKPDERCYSTEDFIGF